MLEEKNKAESGANKDQQKNMPKMPSMKAPKIPNYKMPK